MAPSNLLSLSPFRGPPLPQNFCLPCPPDPGGASGLVGHGPHPGYPLCFSCLYLTSPDTARGLPLASSDEVGESKLGTVNLNWVNCDVLCERLSCIKNSKHECVCAHVSWEAGTLMGLVERRQGRGDGASRTPPLGVWARVVLLPGGERFASLTSVSLPACGLSSFEVRPTWACILALGFLGCS